MKICFLPAIVFSLALATAAYAQDANSAPPPSQNNGGYGQRGGRGGYSGMGAGRGVMGTVTEVAPDHYVVKNEAGDLYTVHFSANTRIFKQAAGQQRGGGQRGGGQGQGGGMGRGSNPPQQIKATDIKVGDVIMAMGEVDATAKSVGAMIIAQVDPERVRQMQEMAANYGKTWLSGKVTAIDGVKVTLIGTVDNTAHSFVADENTTFRKRRDPVTLADIQVGDTVRAEGALKDGIFTATTVDVMPQGGTPNVPRNSPPPQ